ncbi:peptidyl-prolyl cis-trans isomerase FKBP16-1, chloroplastic-like [Phragmites australis]|uniref:peptidyl-prolyl cis-trans isomerase FKBP16-1, chloroplastic-like n=1 Tax=Phragmites australis TaxID=29695 RepID=UPI002D769364|nr:peptidyl-prolyl cis-trans isomerase FKBP16-1, chloroplastic-like [Phragmites australis]XP_062221245.1 peptidyl-prolyl cis-trans isomerase FKBP16-1, chloroplastic-like [Phragmites australis]
MLHLQFDRFMFSGGFIMLCLYSVILSTVDQFSGESKPVTLPLAGKEMIRGLKDVLISMKVGGKRRALIPPEVGYIDETLKPIPEEFGPRRSLLSHAKEPLVSEVQLLKVL